MNSFEMLPTEENLIQALHDDLLQRNKELAYFYDLLLSQKMSSSIAIDGRWGSGKTFFVKQSMLLINAKNPMSGMDANKKRDIINSIPFSKETDDDSENCELAIYYDAWENDNDTDPVLSLVYKIIKQLGIDYDFTDKSNVFKLAGSILEEFIGRNINDIIENLKSESPIAKMKEEKDLHESIKEFFSEILEERGNRLVVFIDELDRCKPSYAVQLLERIKHYLCDDRITFVFSVNLEELQHTIRHYYGNAFDACRYLDRFFDLRISLPPAYTKTFYEKIELDSSDILEQVCRKVVDVFDMELREVSRFYRQVRTAVYEPTHKNHTWESNFTERKGNYLLLQYIVPVLVGLKLVDVSLYNEFVSGKNSKPIMDMYSNSDIGEWLVQQLLNNDEALQEMEGKITVTKEEKLQSLYDAIFVKEYTTNDYCTIISRYRFDGDSKSFVKMASSMLSQYADYEV